MANYSASNKRKFIAEAGRKYARGASVADKRKIEDSIVDQIQAQKRGHI